VVCSHCRGLLLATYSWDVFGQAFASSFMESGLQGPEGIRCQLLSKIHALGCTEQEEPCFCTREGRRLCSSKFSLSFPGVEKGSADPQKTKVGKVTADQVRDIAKEKLPDLNCSSIESATRIIAGTAANMGIDVVPPILEKKVKVVV